MARPPAMTVDEAAALLGDPATFVLTSDNKPIVRKWISALGHPSNVGYKLTNAQLTEFYRTGEFPVSAISSPVPAVAPIRTVPVPAMPTDPFAAVAAASAPAPVARDAAEDLANAIRNIAKGSPMNETRVAEMIEDRYNETLATVSEMIAGAVAAIPPTVVAHRIEITVPGKAPVVIEGLAHEATATVLQVVSLGHNVMLIGPAGCGKTSIGDLAAKALNLPLYVTSTVLDTHEIMGFVDGHGGYHSTAFRVAFEHGGVWIADEIDAWDAAALLAANSALANGFATFPDSAAIVRRHPDFRMIATANTFGHGADRVYVGRNELDAASLDRFATIAIDYDVKLEQALSINQAWINRVHAVRAAVRRANIRAVVSTRAILAGQAALAAGMPQSVVEDIYLFKGMNKADRDKVARF